MDGEQKFVVFAVEDGVCNNQIKRRFFQVKRFDQWGRADVADAGSFENGDRSIEKDVQYGELRRDCQAARSALKLSPSGKRRCPVM
jgi:hypothetical protein